MKRYTAEIRILAVNPNHAKQIISEMAERASDARASGDFDLRDRSMETGEIFFTLNTLKEVTS